MAHPVDDEDPKTALFRGVGAMVAVAVVVGLVVGAVALGAARVAGIGSSAAGGGPSGPASLYIPKYQPTETVDEEWPGLPDPEDLESTPTEPTESPSPSVQEGDEITLYAAPTAVSAGERITLNGVYLDGEGVPLQVQRKEENGWVDFPVTATVRQGVYGTWIQTSRTGETLLRMYDPTTDRVSNAVTVQVN